MPETNLTFRSLPKLSWLPNDQLESLSILAGYVSEEGQTAINWYLDKKGYKKGFAQFLRAVAILATAATGLIPLFAEIFSNEGIPGISPVWASVALAIAATCVGLDRFFGFSSAWMRFLTTEMQIRNTLHGFHLDREIQLASLAGREPTEIEIQEMLYLCKETLSNLNLILKEEMDAWVQEFSAAIRDIDKAAQAKKEIMRLGGANILVTNGDICQEGWALVVDGGPEEIYHGKTAALRSLLPGTHAVLVKGKIDDKVMQVEKAFATAASKIADVQLTLA
jgi:hypothetical protein